jgi:hypothetical protein
MEKAAQKGTVTSVSSILVDSSWNSAWVAPDSLVGTLLVIVLSLNCDQTSGDKESNSLWIIVIGVSNERL